MYSVTILIGTVLVIFIGSRLFVRYTIKRPRYEAYAELNRTPLLAHLTRPTTTELVFFEIGPHLLCRFDDASRFEHTSQYFMVNLITVFISERWRQLWFLSEENNLPLDLLTSILGQLCRLFVIRKFIT
jgi:hypothetical protein